MQNKVDIEQVETVYQGYFRVDKFHLKHSLYQGGMSQSLSREVFQRGHIGAVLLYDINKQCLVMIEQFRPGAYAAGWEPWILECIAGVIEKNETPELLVRREASEEAGCEISMLFPIHHFLSSPGACSETVHLYCGLVDSNLAGDICGLDDEGENIKVRIIPCESVSELLSENKIVNAKTLIALQWFLLNQSKIQQLYKTQFNPG